MKVGDDIVSVMVGAVHGGLAEDDAGDAADSKQEQETEGEQHRGFEFN